MDTHILSGRYQVRQSLASGGMGQTFIAEDTQLPGNPVCVVKQLKPATTDVSFIATAKRLFFSEAETLQKLGTHDQIPRLLAYFEEGSEFYLVQEYIEGNPLSKEILLGQRWSEPQVIQLLQDILEVLSFVHSQKVIHRDIKPDNIIRRDRDNKLVLIDFGAVKQIQSPQANQLSSLSMGTPSGTVAIGTHGYMPLEQISGKPRMSSDLYAVGKIAIQALTGLLPTQLREDEDGEIIWRDQATVSEGFATFLDKMVHDYHKLRYQTSQEALQALHQLTQNSSTSNNSASNIDIDHAATQLPPEAQIATQLDPAASGSISTESISEASAAYQPTQVHVPSAQTTDLDISEAIAPETPTPEPKSAAASGKLPPINIETAEQQPPPGTQSLGTQPPTGPTYNSPAPVRTEAPHPTQTSATVVVSPGQPKTSTVRSTAKKRTDTSQGKTVNKGNNKSSSSSKSNGSASASSKKGVSVLIFCGLAVLAFVGGAIGYTAISSGLGNNQNDGPRQTGTQLNLKAGGGTSGTSTPPEESPGETPGNKPPEISEPGGGDPSPPEEVSPGDNPFKASDFPQRICGDANVTRPFYRVYVLSASLEDTVTSKYCRDAFVESATSRVKVASFDTEEQAIHFKNFIEDNVGAVEIEEVN
ncbi:MAG: protein kinase [Cyanobacteria bacterium J06649_4]